MSGTPIHVPDSFARDLAIGMAAEILSGAKVGDRIVVTGVDAFGGAQRVRIAD
jgi:carbonic anhydrase/acetyltransferase-like protein (isoleucine patch superfamily)